MACTRCGRAYEDIERTYYGGHDGGCVRPASEKDRQDILEAIKFERWPRERSYEYRTWPTIASRRFQATAKYRKRREAKERKRRLRAWREDYKKKRKEPP